MNITYKKEPSKKAKETLEALRSAVTKELEKKKRLGHYAVFSENNKITFVGEDAPLTET
jgi:hypothetical protein